MLRWRSADQLLAFDPDNPDDETSAAFGGLLFATQTPKVLPRYRGSPPIATHQFVVEPEVACDCSICQPRR